MKQTDYTMILTNNLSTNGTNWFVFNGLFLFDFVMLIRPCAVIKNKTKGEVGIETGKKQTRKRMKGRKPVFINPFGAFHHGEGDRTEPVGGWWEQRQTKQLHALQLKSTSKTFFATVQRHHARIQQRANKA